jgi:hypothetical protein
MGLDDLGVEVVKALLPPQNPNDEGEQQRWRWVVFSAIIALSLALISHVALACGWIPWYSGFALNSSVSNIQSRIDLIATQSVENALRNKLTDRCKTQDASYKQELTEEIDNLSREYYSLQHFNYKDPPCASLL